MKKNLLLVILSFTIFSISQSQEWEQLDYEFTEATIAGYHIGVSADNMNLGASMSFNYYQPLQLSSDYGESWTDVFEEAVTQICFDDDNNLYMVDEFKLGINANGSLYKSSDMGQNWEELLNVGDYVDQTGFKVTGSGEIFVPAQGGMEYSADQGASWTYIATPSLPYGVLKTSSGRLIITTYNSGLYYSDDEGGSWSECEGDFGAVTLGYLQEHPSTGKIYVCAFGVVFESSDDGASFEALTPDPWMAMNIAEFEISQVGDFYFYGIYGVYKSSDALTWTLISENLPTGNIYDMALSDNHIYVIVDRHIYKREIDSGSTGLFENNSQAFELTVFPNPGSGSFNLIMEKIDAEEAELFVSDISGKVVYHRNISRDISGNNEILLKLNGLRAGLYFLRIKTDQGTAVTRLEIIN